MAKNISLDPELFLDAAYLIALAEPRDQHHRTAIRIASKIDDKRLSVITTHAVLFEVASSLSGLRHRSFAVQLIDSLCASALVTILPTSEEIVQKGWQLFRNRPDKEWSWADCISFVVMQQRALRQALTTDEYFEQAGFVALLRH